MTIEPHNENTQQKFMASRILLENRKPNVPFKLSEEIKINPYLRADQEDIQDLTNSIGPVQCVHAIREAKNSGEFKNAPGYIKSIRNL